MAITYGMSVKEFWEESPDLFWAYRFSYLNKLKTEQEIFNQNAWLQGAYFHEAISVTIGNAFGKQKLEYSKQPYGTETNNKQEKNPSELLAMKIKERAEQVKAIKGEQNSTTKKGNTKGGEITNERQSNTRITA